MWQLWKSASAPSPGFVDAAYCGLLLFTCLVTFLNSFYKVYIIVMYGHRNLCSVSLVVSCFKISWRQEGSKEGKEKKILSHSLHIRSLLGHSSTFGQAIYNSSLVFTSCLFRAWRSARGKSLGSSRPFLSMHPVLGMYMAFFPPILWYVCQI